MHRIRFKYPSCLAASLCLAAGLGLAAGCGGDDDDDDSSPGDGGTADDGTTDDGTADDDDDGDGGGDGGTGDGADAAPVAECEPQSGTNLGLERVAGGTEDGFDEPIFVTSPRDDGRLFVVSKHGAISIVKNGQVQDTPFLDIDGRVVSGRGNGEQGLLGLAFHPDFADNGRFFVLYTRAEDEFEVLSEFHVDPNTPDVADPESEREILPIRDPEGNHNGGMIAFGPDNYLYVGLGDGGGGGDEHGDIGNGQDKSTLLGDFLRLDIDITDEPGYGIPTDNPYVGSKEEEEEIFISGVRNPWRWSFDRQNGDLYIGDVGQGLWEEIDVLEAGEQSGVNLGWRGREGFECFDDDQCDRPDMTDPVIVYPNPGDGIGAAIVGGYVYRGTCFPDIQGWYFYGDFLSEQVWKLRYVDGEATEDAEVTSDIDPEGVLNGLSSFGQDAAGEIYAVSMSSGEVFRIVAGP
jgi:glucose/arabinose dehydrogenase